MFYLTRVSASPHCTTVFDSTQLAMTSMFVPEPVMSLAISPNKTKKGGADTESFSKVGRYTTPNSRS